MDRVDYIQSIDTGALEYETFLVNYFDQFMGLYGFMQPCNYKTKVINSVDNFLLLELEFVDGESALNIMNVLSSLNHIFSIYGRTFTFDVRIISMDEKKRPIVIQMQISS